MANQARQAEPRRACPATAGQAPARLVIVQPVIPKYRIPLFERIASAPGIDLTVLADIRSPAQLNQYDPARDRFRAVDLPLWHVGPLTFRPGLGRLLSELRPDAVVLQGNPRDVSQIRALRKLNRSGVPVGIWSMFYRIGRRSGLFDAFMRWFGRRGDVLLSYGQRGRQELIELGTDPDRIIVLHNSIDIGPVIAARDAVTDGQLAEFRREQGLDGRRVILHVVRLTAIKRADVMLEAFARLAGLRDDVELVFIGGGPLEGRMKALAGRLGLAGRVRFLGPIYDEGRLALWYKLADVFAMATCIGLSIHHAMCYGVPVVTDDSPLTQTAEFEALVAGRTGLTYRAGDLADFAEKIGRILDDPELRGRMSAGAIRRVEDEYNMERMARRFLDGVGKLLPMRGTP